MSMRFPIPILALTLWIANAEMAAAADTLGVAASAPECRSPDIQIKPKHLLASDSAIAPEDYPPLSVIAGEEGDTIVDFLIATDGTVTDAKVARTSGYPRLDAAAIDLVPRRWHYNPAQKDGSPIACRWQVDIKWRMTDSLSSNSSAPFTEVTMGPDQYPTDLRAKQIEGTVYLMVVVGIDGKPLNAFVLVSSAGSDLSDASIAVIMHKFTFKPGELNGKPIKTAIGLQLVWTLHPVATSQAPETQSVPAH